MMNLYEDGTSSGKQQKLLSYTDSIKRRTKVIDENLKTLNSLMKSGGLDDLGEAGKLYIQTSEDLMMTADDKDIRKSELAKGLMKPEDLITHIDFLSGNGSERFLRIRDLGETRIAHIKILSIQDQSYRYTRQVLGEYFIDHLGNIYEWKENEIIFSHEGFKKDLIISNHKVRDIHIIDNQLADDISLLNARTNVFEGLFKINVYDTYLWRELTALQHLFKAVITTNEMWNPEINKKYSTFLKTDFNKYRNPNMNSEKGSAEVNIVKGTFFTKPYVVVRIYDRVRFTPQGYPAANSEIKDYREAVRIFADQNAWVMFQDFGDNDWVEVPDDFYYNDWVDSFASYVDTKAFAGTALEPYYNRAVNNSRKYKDAGIESYTPPLKCFYSYLKNPIIDKIEEEGGLEELAGQIITYPAILPFSSLVGVFDLEGETAAEILGVSQDQLDRLKEASLISTGGILLFKAFFIKDGIEHEHKDVSHLDDPEYNKIIELIANYYYSYGTDGIVEYIKLLRKAHDKFTIGATNSIGNSFNIFIKKNPDVVVNQRNRFNYRYVEYADVLLDQISEFRRDFFSFNTIEEFAEAYKVMKENKAKDEE